jgi:hypothetical protein
MMVRCIGDGLLEFVAFLAIVAVIVQPRQAPVIGARSMLRPQSRTSIEIERGDVLMSHFRMRYKSVTYTPYLSPVRARHLIQI